MARDSGKRRKFHLLAALDLQGCWECWQPYGTVAAQPSLVVVHAGMTALFKIGRI
jgi:hypothetical protein